MIASVSCSMTNNIELSNRLSLIAFIVMTIAILFLVIILRIGKKDMFEGRKEILKDRRNRLMSLVEEYAGRLEIGKLQCLDWLIKECTDKIDRSYMHKNKNNIIEIIIVPIITAFIGTLFGAFVKESIVLSIILFVIFIFAFILIIIIFKEIVESVTNKRLNILIEIKSELNHLVPYYTNKIEQ